MSKTEMFKIMVFTAVVVMLIVSAAYGMLKLSRMVR